MDQLIVERKFERQNDYWFGADKKILDKFGYYSLVEPFKRILPSGWKSKHKYS
jgi:hypothetical protein